MPHFRGTRGAFGSPGEDARWTGASKDAVGTAQSLGGRVWFTIGRGILTEVYYPTIDRPQLRDLEFLFSGENGMFLEEKRDLAYEIKRIGSSQGYQLTSRDHDGRLKVVKEVIAEPNRPCVLIDTRIEGDPGFLNTLKTYLLCSPHLEVGGNANNAYVVEVSGRQLLVAEKQDRWLAVGASCGFLRLSCGFVGSSDGYSDVKKHGEMTYEFDQAKGGNVALTAELDLRGTQEFTIGVAFGESLPSAISSLFQSLGVSYPEQRKAFVTQWDAVATGKKSLKHASGDGGHLYDASYNILLTHEDKLYQGAFVASLTIPWGEARDDHSGKGGYHLVWTRDMVESAMGLLAAGETAGPTRALIYLAARQKENGSFPQNFWVNGEAFWDGMQLDEVAFPILLAWRLHQAQLLGEFNPRVMADRAAAFLLQSGPVTGEERWEEGSGYSPSTLAAIIAAMICAASFARTDADEPIAGLLESYADFLRSHLEDWTVTTKGSLLAGSPRHFVRLNPIQPGQAAEPGAVDRADLFLTSQPPSQPPSYPARDVIDAGFLQLVRYGILSADDPLIVKSLRVVDAALKTQAGSGACWRRYNHDGYGQKPDGGPYAGWGQGRLWPLLTGERGHYELAAGGDCGPFVKAMEGFASATGLLPEQIWDAADIPDMRLRRGGPTGSANPLVWAHSEYVRLLRSRQDGKVFDSIPEVVKRYRHGNTLTQIEYWLTKHPIRQSRKNHTIRILVAETFRLRWSADAWKTWTDSDSRPTGIGGAYFDVSAEDAKSQLDFTFFWPDRHQWEGRNHHIEVLATVRQEAA